jgi:exodeoxyribonuclease V beta subunit
MSGVRTLDAATVPLEGTTLIEASAGTGKTHTIATLFVRLLIEHGHKVSEILVVTYTRAATAELRQRIRQRVVEALDVFTRLNDGKAFEGKDAERHAALVTIAQRSLAHGTFVRDKQRLVDAIRSFDLAAISTIHGFCQRMLKHSAFESGSDFDLELLDDERTLITEVVEDYWVKTLYDAPDTLIERIGDQKITAATLSALARRAASDPDLRVVPDATHVDTRTLEAAFDAASTRVMDAYAAHAAELRALVSAERHFHQGRLRADALAQRIWPTFAARVRLRPGQLPDWFKHLCAGSLPMTSKAKDIEPKHVFFDACAALGRVDVELTQALDGNVAAFVHECLRFVRVELARRKAARRVQSFDDLLLRLREAASGRQGAKLLSRIRTLHPAALIDEFQDTDPVQCEVFQRIYDPGSPAPGVLFFIGDPKQAIYAFRGADVFAYMAAARKASQGEYTLDINRRSDPKLVAAVNRVFERAHAPFLFENIRFLPVAAERDRQDALPASEAAFDFVLLPEGLKQGTPDTLRASVAEHVAQDIVTRLAGDTLNGARIEPQHVAVLCRTNKQAVQLQDALRERGVPTVLDGDRSVFESKTSAELLRVLAAMCEPSDSALVRSALVTSLFGVDAAALAELSRNETDWDRWVGFFHEWQKLWEQRGFIQAMHALLDSQGVRARLLALRDGERRLTDLDHLIELLQTEAMRSGEGAFALLAWFRRVREGEIQDAALAAEAAQLRLESDALAVTLTTIHKSKGLQYPIVYLPYLWDGRLMHAQEKARPRYHDPAYDNRLTLSLDPTHDALAQAEREVRAENLRLLYVALTRARHKNIVVWGAFPEMEMSALTYLVHQAAPAPLTDLALATVARAKALDDNDVLADLQTLVSEARGAIGVRRLSAVDERLHRVAAPAAETLRARELSRRVLDVLRTSSFSRLSAGAKDAPIPATDDAVDRDATGIAEDVTALVSQVPPAGSALRVPLADFAAGVTAGHLIHEIYETLDFRSDHEAFATHAKKKLAAYGMDSSQAQLLGHALHAAANAPLGAGALPTLAHVAPEDRLTELEFVFPVAFSEQIPPSTARRLHARALSRVLMDHATTLAQRNYATRVAHLSFAELSGYLRGFMDLVVRHRGRYYLLDYKSNHLGELVRDYGAVAMWDAMSAHHYVLQYLLYCVALHRYLALRQPGYSYEKHFGGVYYLFIRGMAPEHTRGAGVYYDKPTPALVHALDTLLREGAGS